MDRFFFDMTFNGESIRDDTGLELDGAEEARAEVLKALPDIARDVFVFDGDQQELCASVRNGAGRVLYTAHLSLTAGWVT